jgi:hypothetical protein
MGVGAVLFEIHLLLANPDPTTSNRPELAGEYVKKRAEYDQNAMECTVAYARGGVAIASGRKISEANT